MEKHLVGRVISASIGPTNGDTIRRLGFRRGQGEAPGTMDENLEREILGKITKNISETCAGKIVVRTPPISATRYI